MAAFKDLTGKRFGRLTAICPTTERSDRYYIWRCICDCGNEHKVSSHALTQSNTKSCGCLNRESSAQRMAERRTTHGHTRRTLKRKATPEYVSYQSAKTRSTNPGHKSYADYAGQGVLFLFKSFEEFLQSVGPKPAGTSLGRYADLSNYAPNECCWMTRPEQALAAMNKEHLLAWAERAQEAA